MPSHFYLKKILLGFALRIRWETEVLYNVENYTLNRIFLWIPIAALGMFLY